MKLFKNGKVTIITPCYNGERFLNRFFDSIYKQTYKNIELIIINDGSTDNSEKICIHWKSKFEDSGSDFIYISQKLNCGSAGAINKGLKYVTGEFLIWPDCDDYLMPTSIEKRVEYLNQNQHYAMVRSDYIAVNEKNINQIITKGSEWADVKNEYIFDNLIFEKTYVTSGCYMARSSILFERLPNGEIYCKNKGGQNWQLLLPISYMNKTGYIDEPLYKYIVRNDSHSHLVKNNKYCSHKERIKKYNEILINVISNFDMLPDNEKEDYLNKIEIKYAMTRLNLALRHNKFNDAKLEIQILNQFNVRLTLPQQMLYYLCKIGVSRTILRGQSLYKKIYKYYKKRVGA